MPVGFKFFFQVGLRLSDALECIVVGDAVFAPHDVVERVKYKIVGGKGKEHRRYLRKTVRHGKYVEFALAFADKQVAYALVGFVAEVTPAVVENDNAFPEVCDGVERVARVENVPPYAVENKIGDCEQRRFGVVLPLYVVGRNDECPLRTVVQYLPQHGSLARAVGTDHDDCFAGSFLCFRVAILCRYCLHVRRCRVVAFRSVREECRGVCAAVVRQVQRATAPTLCGRAVLAALVRRTASLHR